MNFLDRGQVAQCVQEIEGATGCQFGDEQITYIERNLENTSIQELWEACKHIARTRKYKSVPTYADILSAVRIAKKSLMREGREDAYKGCDLCAGDKSFEVRATAPSIYGSNHSYTMLIHCDCSQVENVQKLSNYLALGMTKDSIYRQGGWLSLEDIENGIENNNFPAPAGKESKRWLPVTYLERQDVGIYKVVRSVPLERRTG